MLDLLDSRASRMSMSVAMRSQCLKICLPTFESSMHTPISSVLSMSTTRSCGRSFVSLFVNWSGYTLCLSDTLPIFSTSAWARISWQTLTSWLLKVCTQWPGLYCTHIYVQYTLYMCVTDERKYVQVSLPFRSFLSNYLSRVMRSWHIYVHWFIFYQ